MKKQMDEGHDALEARLKSLIGAEVEKLSESAFVITVLNQDDWNENILQLKDFFWPLIKDAYKREEDELERQLSIDFENAKKVYIERGIAGLKGFCSIEQYAKDPSIGIVRDIIVEEKERGKGIGEKLYTSLFANHEFKAVIGVSLNFGAIKTRIKVSEKYGYKGYYGPQGGGDTAVEYLRGVNNEYMSHESLLDESVGPPPSWRRLGLLKARCITSSSRR